jgi:hypothetical protein
LSRRPVLFKDPGIIESDVAVRIVTEGLCSRRPAAAQGHAGVANHLAVGQCQLEVSSQVERPARTDPNGVELCHGFRGSIGTLVPEGTRWTALDDRLDLVIPSFVGIHPGPSPGIEDARQSAHTLRRMNTPSRLERDDHSLRLVSLPISSHLVALLTH